MTNDDSIISCLQRSTELPDRELFIPGQGNSASYAAEGPSVDHQHLDASVMHCESSTLKVSTQRAAIIEALLRRCQHDHLQDAGIPKTDGQNRLPQFLARIPGCDWLRGQFNSRSHPPGARSTQPDARHAIPAQKHHCDACRSDWPHADRFCVDLASQARDQQLMWHEVTGLASILSRRVADNLLAPQIPDFADIATVPDPSAGDSSLTEPEVVTPEGFVRFVREHLLQLIYYFTNKRLQLEDAQDLAQETIMILWQRRQEWSSPHRTFMVKIARGLYFAHLRTLKNRMLNLDAAPEQADPTLAMPMSDDLPDEPPAKNKLPAQLFARIGTLSQNQQKVVRMLYVEGLSLQQAADKMGISKSSVQTHARRAIAALKSHWSQKGEV